MSKNVHAKKKFICNWSTNSPIFIPLYSDCQKNDCITKIAMMRKSILLTALLLTLVCAVFAQKRQITGKIVDATNNEPLVGVSIVSDKKKSTTTKIDGTYSIEVDSSTKALIFSHVSYGMQTVPLTDQNTINIRMLPATEKTLEDVVVIGYGTQ